MTRKGVPRLGSWLFFHFFIRRMAKAYFPSSAIGSFLSLTAIPLFHPE
jgi:hypothetical protein